MTDPNGAKTSQPEMLETQPVVEDGRRFSPSTSRNQAVVRDTFLEHLPDTGHILEVASGTGEHGTNITAAAPDIVWTYSDADPGCLRSQKAWAVFAGHGRLRGPYELNTCAPDWGEVEAQAPYDGVFCANMIHIAPFEAAVGLFAGAGRILTPKGKLFLYGPYARQGEIAPSNVQFNEVLQQRDVRWGVRDLDRELLPLAKQNGLGLDAVVEMPANNLSVIFSRR